MTVHFLIPPIFDRRYFWLFEIGKVKVGFNPSESWGLSMGENVMAFPQRDGHFR